MTKTKDWKPKVGDTVKYVAVSRRTGLLVNVRLTQVRNVTSKYIHAGLARDQKFHRGPVGPCLEYVPTRAQKFSSIRARIEPASQIEIETLPTDPFAGADYARLLNQSMRAAS